MIVRTKVLAVGLAGVMAVGWGGLYAGTLTVTATGTLGASSVAAQASCATTINVAPGLATYDPTDERMEYNDVDLDITEASNDACYQKYANATVYDTDDGSVLASGTAAQVTDQSTDTAASVNITLSTGVDAGAGDTAFAVVVQDVNS